MRFQATLPGVRVDDGRLEVSRSFVIVVVALVLAGLVGVPYWLASFVDDDAVSFAAAISAIAGAAVLIASAPRSHEFGVNLVGAALAAAWMGIVASLVEPLVQAGSAAAMVLSTVIAIGSGYLGWRSVRWILRRWPEPSRRA